MQHNPSPALEPMQLGILLSFASLYFWILLEITLHEFGHILVGKLVGFRPYALIIGKGRRIFRGNLGGLTVTFHVLPFGGATLAGRPQWSGLWWRGALFSLAGVMSDVLLLWGLLLILRHFNPERMSGSLPKILFGLFMPFAIYQGVAIVANLVPYDLKWHGLTISNDGRQFLGYIMGQTPTEDYIRNVRCCDPEFRPETSWFMVTNRESFATLEAIERDKAMGDHESAARRYLELLDLPALTKGERAMMLDSLASLALVLSDLSFRERALQWASEAYELFPNAATLRGSYGAALVESGEYQRGIDLLTPLTTEGNAVSDMEISSCYLAKAYARLGDETQAWEWLDRGRKSGAFQALSERIEREMGTTGA